MIADRYKTALENYLEQLKRVVSDAAVDYHRVTIDRPYEEVLANFLLGRAARKKGRR